MSDIILPSKLVGERITVRFDFNDVLDWGETITAQSVGVSVISGTDSLPSLLLYKTATAVQTVVSQQIHAGLPGVLYKLTCQVTGSTGQIYCKESNLAVLPSNHLNPPIIGTALTSRVYPVEAIDSIEAQSLLIIRGQFVNRNEDSLAANMLQVVDAIIWGGQVLYSHPPEDAVNTSLSVIDSIIWGGQVLATGGPDAISVSQLLVVDAIIWGDIIVYEHPDEDAISGSLSVISGSLT